MFNIVSLVPTIHHVGLGFCREHSIIYPSTIIPDPFYSENLQRHALQQILKLALGHFIEIDQINVCDFQIFGSAITTVISDISLNHSVSTI